MGSTSHCVRGGGWGGFESSEQKVAASFQVTVKSVVYRLQYSRSLSYRRQGPIPSPPFSALFIDGLLQCRHGIGEGTVVHGGRLIPAVMQTDDLLLICNSIERMNKLLEACFRYASLWDSHSPSHRIAPAKQRLLSLEGSSQPPYSPHSCRTHLPLTSVTPSHLTHLTLT
eukprot:GHVN01087454.1.p1 GENE.GHVN01087454.1~~GHVN01087454.1.p1  ORF type:complete len:170 (-),score=27.55 GHVN01087454.1:741-1250(-)